ncbi:hypothetical protein C5167_034695 [Papaver somniferum]|uniref:Uncharacterized protein n=1 Tax=Papaver somniferum TaxID=3469 RepID=A0A4Y7KHD8_PAPSO|nr:hypothetical protein C5167_034695 [Papaver somniferum]
MAFGEIDVEIRSRGGRTLNLELTTSIMLTTLEDMQYLERKSFAVSTGELFLGLASRIIKSTQVKYEGGGDDTSSVPVNSIFTEIQNEVGMDIDEESVFTGRVRTNVVAQEQPVMIWDQKDFEGDELNRKKAGLLFPYHLGVAEDQIATRVDNDASAVVAENMADITNTNQCEIFFT